MSLNQFSYPLNGFAVSHWKRLPANPLEHIAPTLSTEGALMGTYKRYPQGYAFRALDTKRAPFTEARTIGVDAEDVPFKLEDHSLRVAVDDSELKPGAGSDAAAADQIAQSRISSLLATWRTSSIVDGLTYFRAAVAAESDAGNWSAASADPIEELRELINRFRNQNGVTPNRMLIPYEAWDVLASNAKVMSAIVYNDAQTLTKKLLLKLLGFDEDDMQAPSILRASVPVGAANPGPGVAFNGSNALGMDVWMTYVDEGDLLGNMCGMRTLYAGGDSPVESVESYYERAKRSTFYEVGMHRAFAVTAPSCNVRLTIS